nr:hypothetical protein [Tanacetum cinerariifolium]
MTTLAEHIIFGGAENHHSMLEKSMYDSWESHVRLFIKGKKHDRMMLDSIDNGPLVYLTIEENRQTRPKKYSELTKAQQLQDDCDVQAMNIILHGLSPDVETLYEYYWRFSQLINDMYTIGMTMQQVQVNTKFLNALPSEWSKFFTDMKLAKGLYTTNYDQLYAYLSQHEQHANEFCITRERYLDPLVFLDFGLAVLMFQQGEDLIECINKAIPSRFPPSTNQLRTSSNPKNQATIQNAEAQEAGQILDEEQLVFLANPGYRSQLMNFVSKFLGTVQFRNDQVAKIMGYGDYQQWNENTYFIQNLEGVDLLLGSRDTNLYTISLDDMLNTFPICLLSKASKTKSWLWHRRLSHLNFGTLNKLAKYGLARVPVAVAPRAVKIADSLVSTSIDQDASSLSILSAQDQEYSLIISQGVEELQKTPLFHDDHLHGFLYEDSTSQGS